MVVKKKKFYYSKDEMLKDAELESRKILADYNSTTKKIKPITSISYIKSFPNYPLTNQIKI